MPISALPPAPQPTDTQAQFNTKAFNLVAALNTFVTEANAVEAAADADAAAAAASAASAATQADNAATAAATAVAAGTAITAGSATSLSITTGSKSLTIETGRAFVAGMPVRIGQAGANANVNYMDGDVTSYDAATGALVVDVGSTGGAGTFSSWSVRAANTRLPDQTGNAGKFLTTSGTNASWSNVQGATFAEFTASGTWTKPAGATFVMVELWGAGGGGGSGRRAAAGDRYGGGGAGGGAYGYRLFKASDLGATEAVTIGAGGAGGAAVTADDTNGANGTAGGGSAFGAWLTMYGGSPGGGGDGSAGSGGPGGGVLGAGGQPAVLDSSRDGHFGRGGPSGTASGFGGGYGGNSPSAGGSSYQGGPAGGGGGLINSTNTYLPPGSGGGIVNQSGSGAERGAYPGTAGASGTGRQGGAGGTVGSVTVDSCVDVTFGNATFAGVSSGGIIWTSSNGTNNWVAQTGPSNLPVTRLMHDGTQFVLFDTSSRVWTTTDFSTYTARANGPWAGSIQKVRYQNGRYFVVRAMSNGVYTSTDLVTWTQVTSGNGSSTYDICWSGTNYVVVSAGAPSVRYSSDLVTWSTATGAGVPNTSYTCTSNGLGTVVINANTSSVAQEVSRSTDHGQTFTAASTTLATAQSISNTASYHGGTYFLVWSSNLWTSGDGSSWTQRSTASGLFGTVGYDNTTLAVGDSTSSTNTVAYTSTLGGLSTWTSRTLTAINGAAGAGGAGGQPGGGGGGGGPSTNSHDSGAGGAGGGGLARIYTW